MNYRVRYSAAKQNAPRPQGQVADTMTKLFHRSAQRPEFPLGKKEFERIENAFRPLTEPQQFEIADIWREWLSEFGLWQGAPRHGEVRDMLKQIETASRRLLQAMETSVKGDRNKRRLDQLTTWSGKLGDLLKASMQGPRRGKKNVTGDGVTDQLVKAGVESVILTRLILAAHLLPSTRSLEPEFLGRVISDADQLHAGTKKALAKLGIGKRGPEENPLDFLIWRLADFSNHHCGPPTASWNKSGGRKSPFVRLVIGLNLILPDTARAQSDNALGERVGVVLKRWRAQERRSAQE